MEPGPVPGTLSFSLTTVYGSNFEGGHESRRGTGADRQPVTVPLYRHEVSLDYARVELALQYTVSAVWDLVLRMPWEWKDQQSGIGLLAEATPEQRAAMQRNADLHHRNVALSGAGDAMFVSRRRSMSVWRAGDALSLAGGATLPTGNTVENPYILGDRGVPHLHIQFGTGTFDPVVEASYSMPLASRLRAGADAAARLPLYANRRSFRAPPELALAAHLAHQTSERLTLRAEGVLYGQGYGEWDGVRDENTGLLAASIGGGATVRVRTLSISGDVRVPVAQRTLTEGDAFSQGPTFIVSIGGRLRMPD